jgi:hypothetical protein
MSSVQEEKSRENGDELWMIMNIVRQLKTRKGMAMQEVKTHLKVYKTGTNNDLSL